MNKPETKHKPKGGGAPVPANRSVSIGYREEKAELKRRLKSKGAK